MLKVNNFSINRQIPAYTSYFDVAEFQIKCVNELEWNAMPQYKINKSSEACKTDAELPLLPTVLERY
jgi:hypothetical protein